MKVLVIIRVKRRMSRLGTPDDLVGIVLYLSSDEANWTTGQFFIVDGGHATK